MTPSTATPTSTHHLLAEAAAAAGTTGLDAISRESRLFAPPPGFAAKAHVPGRAAYDEMYARSIANPEAFWAGVAGQLHWFKAWDKVLDDTDKPFYKWFVGGKTNLCYNCLDKHLGTATANKAAIIWEGEPGEERVLTYRDLYREVCQFANGLKSLGIRRGDRVAIYLPMTPELVIAVLACARIGAPHTVIFAGFTSDAIRDRVQDCSANLVITADRAWRRGNLLNLKSIVDEAVASCPSIEKVVVALRNPADAIHCPMALGRDIWWHRLMENQPLKCPVEEMDSEDLLFLLYTSGTTGKPKGIIHTTGGYMVYTYLTSRYVFDLKPEDVYWCTADLGWITGHSYVVYGPLQNGATCLIYEGAPNWPDAGRMWRIVEKYGVTIFYTAPTAIRAFMKWGDHWPKQADLSTLRLLGTVGEPINPEAWMWYHHTIGGGRCPIVDTFWQTETGGIVISPLPGAVATKPGSATLPFFGIQPMIVDDEARPAKSGYLVLTTPWPGMLRGIWGDPERYRSAYWGKFNGQYYVAGDGAHTDDDGYFWIVGRVDDVVNVSGHRIGTAELESIFAEHPSVAEAAVIGVKHDLKGQGMVAFVVLREGNKSSESLTAALISMVENKIGKFARPEKIIYSVDVPKTRSGKIMRRLLRDIAEGRALGNVTTLADPGVINALKDRYSEG